ncbi:hypothetical protein NW757_000957 [Fusarium falciforme]|nr:hypothetical protein NW757_000957 [Fusarium falciforme]
MKIHHTRGPETRSDAADDQSLCQSPQSQATMSPKGGEGCKRGIDASGSEKSRPDSRVIGPGLELNKGDSSTWALAPSTLPPLEASTSQPEEAPMQHPRRFHLALGKPEAPGLNPSQLSTSAFSL